MEYALCRLCAILVQRIFPVANGEKFLNENKEILYKYIDERKPLTRLDVEELSQRALFMQTNSPIFNYIKDYVYEAPSYKGTDGCVFRSISVHQFR